jgi:hypothetical protein
MTIFRSIVVIVTGLGLGSPGGGVVWAQERPRQSLTVSVDPRVELMSVLFRLAGNQEYNQGKVPSYVRDVDAHFLPMRDHPAVKLAAQLRERDGISFDAVMSMAFHVTDAFSLQERVPLLPRPKSLDARWTPETSRQFLSLAREFVVASHFKEFIDEHQPLYRAGIQHMQELLDKNAHLEWFDQFFGPRKGADFRVVLGMLNGGGSYGVHFVGADGHEELYSILGVWMVDSQGQPTFPAGMVSTLVHEFTHSYTNALVDQFAKDLQAPGEKLFDLVGPEMKKQAYGQWKTLMYESLNRACGLRYILAYDGPVALQKAILYENSRSFFWVGELADVLAEYDTQPRKYKDLAEFLPRIVAFFNEYAKTADARLGAIKEKNQKQVQEGREKGPKVLAVVPADGAQDVDPNLKAIVVTFDRPMQDKSWSVVTLGSGGKCPQGVGSVGYDTSRKVFTMPVKLEPATECAFGLNGGQYNAFRSQEGIPLAPMEVHFRTRP